MDKPPALSPFRTVDGVSVPEAASLREGFQAHRDDRGYSRILLNVSADRIALVFRWLVERIPGPGYFVLETGTHEVEERKLRKTATDPFHCDVWHLDGLQSADMLAILGDYERLLVHDGMVRFGYGAHGCVDEVFVGPYKLFHMYAADAPPVTAQLHDLGFPEVSTLRTAWDTFTSDRPGCRMALTDIHPSLEDLMAALVPRGLHLAERRPDS